MSGENHQIADQGDTVTVTATFVNTSGVLASPVTVTFAQRTPPGVESTTTSGITSASVGVFTKTVALNAPGLWRFEMRGVGNSVDQVVRYAVDVMPRAVSA